jgi:HK97 family phage major capsid protein
VLAVLLNLSLVTALAVFLLGIVLAPGNRRRLNDIGDLATLDVNDLREQAVGLRDACLAAVTRVGELRSVSPDKRGETYTADFRSALDELNSSDAMHQAVTRILAQATEDEQRSRNKGRGPSAATGAHTGDDVDTRSAGAQVIDDSLYADFQAGRSKAVEIEVRTLLDGTGTGVFRPVGQPVLNPNGVDRRRLFVRDLLSGGQTGLSSVPYIREVSPRTSETGATTVAEGAAKPEVGMAFVQADAPVRKIAAWIPATSEALADAPTLRSYIDARLAYMLAVREEDQVLNGNGSAPNLTGIRNTTGLQTQAGTAGDNATSLANAIAKIELVDGEPDGVAMNPTDFWAMVTRRGGDGHYDVDPFVDPARLTPWGLPAVRTRSLAAGTAIVGAWRIGAQLLDREQTTIRVGEQHADYFVYNKVAILAEERVALLNHRPDYFVEVTFAA